MKKKAFILGLIIIICIASLTACDRAEQSFVFGTVLDIKAEGIGSTKAIENIEAYMQSLEDLLSPTIEGSDVNKINNSTVGEAVVCSQTTMEIYKVALSVYEASDGAYDPSVYPLVRLWKFSGDLFNKWEGHTVPAQEQIDEARAVVGLKDCFVADFENSTITKLKDGAMLDFGGVAKGYAVQKSLDMVQKRALVNLGGNIGAKGKDYAVGIANPTRSDRQYTTSYFAKFTLQNGECVATSGDYERYYTVDGAVYHHIIDPRTGMPCATSGEDGVISCSVISADGAISDAVATAVVVLGKQRGVELLEKLGLKAVVIDGNSGVTTVGNISIEIK